MWLLQRGADLTRLKQDGWQDTALHYAAGSGSMECVQALLAWGADATLANSLGEAKGWCTHLLRCCIPACDESRANTGPGQRPVAIRGAAVAQLHSTGTPRCASAALPPGICTLHRLAARGRGCQGGSP